MMVIFCANNICSFGGNRCCWYLLVSSGEDQTIVRCRSQRRCKTALIHVFLVRKPSPFFAHQQCVRTSYLEKERDESETDYNTAWPICNRKLQMTRESVSVMTSHQFQ